MTNQIEDNFEAQQLNDYYNWKPVISDLDDPEDIQWTPVAEKHIEENEDVDAITNARDSDYDFLKLMRMKRFNEGR